MPSGRARVRRLLVPLDGSSLAEQALPVGARIARRDGTVLHIVQVHLPLPYGGSRLFAGIDGALRGEEEEYLASVARRLHDRHGLDVRSKLLSDPVGDALRAYVSSEHIDVVVMTTHGRTGIRRAWLGSVADGMVRKSAVPVLMVRPSAKRARQRRAPEFTRILIPLDGSSSAEAVVPHALDLAGADTREVLLIRVVEPVTIPMRPSVYAAPTTRPDAEAIERLVSAASNYLDAVADRIRGRLASVRVRTTVAVSRHAAKAILDAATRFDARLVAMTTRGRGASRLLLGGTADKALRGLSVPLLLYRPPAS
jgi:nucleotide-binding universal stress UspA family protein